MGIYKKIVFTLLIIGFLFRLFIIFCLPVRKFEDTVQRYHNLAVNLIEGRGFSHLNSPPYPPSLLRPPTYPLFLAGIYRIFGVNVDTVKIIQALLDILGCLVLFYLACNYFSERVAFVVFSLAIFNPITAVYTNLVNPESLTLFLMILSLWLISKILISNKSIFFFATGLSVMLMAYCRPEFFSFIFIFGIYLIVAQNKKSVNKIALYIFGVLLIMTPWIIRNYNLTGKFIPLVAGGGLGPSLYLGTLDNEVIQDSASLSKFFRENPEVEKRYKTEWRKIELNNKSSLDERISHDRFLLKMALDNIKNDPRKYLFTVIKRMPRVWINLHADEFAFLNTQKLRLLHPDFRKIIYYTKENPKEILILGTKNLLFVINIFYLLMAIVGLYVSRKKLLQLFFIIIPLIYAQIFFLFSYVAATYTVPYWSCIIFFSAIGFYHTFLKERELNKNLDF